jgi:hypothetical protein
MAKTPATSKLKAASLQYLGYLTLGTACVMVFYW